MAGDEGKTGALVAMLAEGVKSDLEGIAEALGALRGQVDALGDASKAINGLAASCAGWSDHLNTLQAGVLKEVREVPAKLLGRAIPEITSSVDADQVERVRRAKA